MKRITRILLCLTLALGLSLPALAQEKKAEEKPDPLAFPMTDLADKTEQASKILRGKATVLAFAQSACGACREELGMLTVMAQEQKGKYNFYVVMVDMSGNGPNLQKFLDDLGVNLKGFKDPKFVVAGKFNVGTTPSTVILNPKGEAVEMIRGFSPEMKDSILKSLQAASK